MGRFYYFWLSPPTIFMTFLISRETVKHILIATWSLISEPNASLTLYKDTENSFQTVQLNQLVQIHEYLLVKCSAGPLAS